MDNSKQLAGLIGPAIIAITISESINSHIWAGNTAAGVHFNGSVLFVTGLAIVRAHNLWLRRWPVLITLTGWSLMLLGLFRMFFPELQLAAARQAINVINSEIILILIVGVVLTFNAYRRKA